MEKKQEKIQKIGLTIDVNNINKHQKCSSQFQEIRSTRGVGLKLNLQNLKVDRNEKIAQTHRHEVRNQDLEEFLKKIQEKEASNEKKQLETEEVNSDMLIK